MLPNRIVTKKLKTKAQRDVKSSQQPNFTMHPLSLLLNILSFLSPQIVPHTPTCHKRPPLSLKGEWRRNSSIVTLMLCTKADKAATELLKEGTQHRPCKIFLCHLTQQTTKRSDKRSLPSKKPINIVNLTKQELPDKEFNFLRNLNPPKHIKDRLLQGSMINQQPKQRFTTRFPGRIRNSKT